MSILGISEKPLSSPAYPFGSVGTMKGRDRDFMVTVITDFADLILEIVKFVRNLFVPETTWSKTREVESLIVNTPTQTSAPTERGPLSKKEITLATFYLFQAILKSAMHGVESAIDGDTGKFSFIFPSEMKGTVGKIWTDGIKQAEGATLTIEKELKGTINFETGKVTLDGKGIEARQRPKIRLPIIGEITGPEITLTLNEFTIRKQDEFTFYADSSFENTYTSDEIAGTLPYVDWGQDKAQFYQKEEVSDELITGQSPPVTAITWADETGELDDDFADLFPKPSLLNRVTTFAGENGQVIIGTVSAAAILGAHLLGFI